jgi:hypothetical protein
LAELAERTIDTPASRSLRGDAGLAELAERTIDTAPPPRNEAAGFGGTELAR